MPSEESYEHAVRRKQLIMLSEENADESVDGELRIMPLEKEKDKRKKKAEERIETDG